jgi:CheY-like chemotaxis protein
MSAATVLIVDDEGPMRSSVKRTLDLHGYDTTAAGSYQEALERLREKPFDVLLTDLRMKGPDGLELIRATHASSPATRPILMSAYATARDSQTALELGAVRVLCKPFETSELLEAVRRAIDNTEGFFGAVHGLSLIDMLQMFHYTRRSLTLRLLGSLPASISFDRGEIVDARCAEQSGEEALAQILALPPGPLVTAALELPARSIEREFRALLLDHLRQLDEHNRSEALRMSVQPSLLVAGSSSAVPVTDSLFDLISEPKISMVPLEGGGTRHDRAELDQACRRIAAFVTGALACALVDLDSGLLLGLSEVPRAESTGALLARSTHGLFRGPAATALDELVQAVSVPGGNVSQGVDELQVSTAATLHFCRRLAGGRHAIALVTNRSTNLAMVWLQLRSTLPALEQLLRGSGAQSNPAPAPGQR